MAAKAGKELGKEKVVDLNQLSIPELDRLKSQVDQEVAVLSSSLAQLKSVQQRLNNSKDSLSSFSPANKGKHMLVPLTSSMYVSGNLKSTDTVLVDIGTGYYVEKSIKDAEAFFTRRMDHVSKQLESVQPAIKEKRKLLEAITMVLQVKMQMFIGMQQEQMRKTMAAGGGGGKP